MLNREDIIEMAREAGLLPCQGIHPGDLERFAALVAAAEREACARVCEESNAFDWPECAAAIRARGQA